MYICIYVHTHQGCSGAGTRGTASPHFFRQGGRVPHFFGLKFVQKLVHCCNWLLTEMQCKIISVFQYSRINIDLLQTLKYEKLYRKRRPKIRCGNFSDVYECTCMKA